MSEMAPEIPDVQVDYEYDNNVLFVTVSLDAATVAVTLDWNEDGADPGSNFNLLHQILPTAIARAHQEVNSA